MNIARLENYLQKACLLVLAYIPFHALLSTWAISNFGGELFWKGLKDLVVCGIGLGAVVLYLYRKPAFRKNERLLLYVMIGYAGLLAGYAAVGENRLAAFAGLILSIRFLLFFGALLVIARSSQEPEKFVRAAVTITVCGFLAVIAFGVLQITVLPLDFLRHFGYSYDLIPPYFEVDGNNSVVRILSTLRGPNPLGAYLAAMAPIAAAVWFAAKKRLPSKYFAVIAAGFAMVLYRTYSRSAVIGLMAAAAASMWFVSIKWRKRLLGLSVAIAVIAALGLGIFRDSLFVQRVVFHNDPHDSNSVNSDHEHASSIRENLRENLKTPLGHGLGSAGLASTYGSSPRTVENYYLEVWFQLGAVGLVIFLCIQVQLLNILWKMRKTFLCQALIVSLIGTYTVNIFWPAWTDETLSLTIWGLAGLVIGANTLGNKKKIATVINDGKTKAKN